MIITCPACMGTKERWNGFEFITCTACDKDGFIDESEYEEDPPQYNEDQDMDNYLNLDTDE